MFVLRGFVNNVEVRNSLTDRMIQVGFTLEVPEEFLLFSRTGLADITNHGMVNIAIASREEYPKVDDFSKIARLAIYNELQEHIDAIKTIVDQQRAILKDKADT